MPKHRGSTAQEVRDLIQRIPLGLDEIAPQVGASVKTIKKWLEEGAPHYRMAMLKTLVPVAEASPVKPEAIDVGPRCVITLSLVIDVANPDPKAIMAIENVLQCLRKIIAN